MITPSETPDAELVHGAQSGNREATGVLLTGTVTSRWNATQVYQRKNEGWRIIHSHWSETRSAQP
jgi:hypothetical protein